METIYSGSETSKAIKAELKKAFPKTKFSVRYSSFAGGNSVDIRWSLGPTVKQVDAITDKYQYGSFNGMEDLYEYAPTLVSLPSGAVANLDGVKYVQTSRNIPDDVFEHALLEICKLECVTPIPSPRGGYWDTMVRGEYASTLVNRAFHHIDFHGFEYAGIGYNFTRDAGHVFDAVPMVPGCQPSPLATVEG